MYELRDTPGCPGKYDVLSNGELIATAMDSITREEMQQQVERANQFREQMERERDGITQD